MSATFSLGANGGRPAPQGQGDGLLPAALEYAAQGWPVLPLHDPTAGRCSCGGAACSSPAKHPRTAHGILDASIHRGQIRAWWTRWPAANIGLAVPREYIVVDIDGPEGTAALLDGDYELPMSAAARTGRGYHLVYRTVTPIAPRVALLPHIDLRGFGSYIVAPPSLHANGTRYTWAIPLAHAAPAPGWIGEIAGRADGPTARGDRATPRVNTDRVLAGVGLGERDAMLFRLACKLRHADVPYGLAEELLLRAASRCSPPFAERDARAKVRAAYGRYGPGPERVATGETSRSRTLDWRAARLADRTRSA